jgi:hypothetical protein
MTENNPQGVIEPQTQAAPVQSTPSVPHGTSQNLIPQEKVNEFVKDAWQRGHDKALREQQLAAPAHDPEAYRKIAQEEFAKAHATMQQKMYEDQQKAYSDQMYKALDGKMKTVSASKT